jgi:hypothetical protein
MVKNGGIRKWFSCFVSKKLPETEDLKVSVPARNNRMAVW